MPKLKLPKPPLPPRSSRRRARPGTGNGKPTRSTAAKEAGITVVDWVDERTSLSGAGAG